MPQTAAGNLGTQLGELLFGRPDNGKAYYQGQLAGATVGDRMASRDDHMASARANRAKAMLGETRNTGLTSLRDSYRALGYTDAQADLMANSAMANGGVNLQNALGSAMMVQIPVAGSEVVPQLGDQFQRALGRQTTKIDEGQVYNPYASSDQPIRMTALGDATVADKRASAGEHAAHTRLYDTQTAAGGFNPHTGATKYTAPTAPDALVYLGDPRSALAFTSWRGQHPEYPNGDAAWAAFRASRPIGAPTGEPAKDDDEAAPIYEAPGAVDLSRLGEAIVNSAPATPAPAARRVVRTGTTKDGRKVVQYDDGTIDYAH